MRVSEKLKKNIEPQNLSLKDIEYLTQDPNPQNLSLLQQWLELRSPDGKYLTNIRWGTYSDNWIKHLTQDPNPQNLSLLQQWLELRSPDGKYLTNIRWGTYSDNWIDYLNVDINPQNLSLLQQWLELRSPDGKYLTNIKWGKYSDQWIRYLTKNQDDDGLLLLQELLEIESPDGKYLTNIKWGTYSDQWIRYLTENLNNNNLELLQELLEIKSPDEEYLTNIEWGTYSDQWIRYLTEKQDDSSLKLLQELLEIKSPDGKYLTNIEWGTYSDQWIRYLTEKQDDSSLKLLQELLEIKSPDGKYLTNIEWGTYSDQWIKYLTKNPNNNNLELLQELLEIKSPDEEYLTNIEWGTYSDQWIRYLTENPSNNNLELLQELLEIKSPDGKYLTNIEWGTYSDQWIRYLTEKQDDSSLKLLQELLEIKSPDEEYLTNIEWGTYSDECIQILTNTPDQLDIHYLRNLLEIKNSKGEYLPRIDWGKYSRKFLKSSNEMPSDQLVELLSMKSNTGKPLFQDDDIITTLDTQVPALSIQSGYPAMQLGYPAMQLGYPAMQPLGMYSPYFLSSDDKEVTDINTKLLHIESGCNNISNNRASSPKFSIDTEFLRLIQSDTYVDKTELILELVGFERNRDRSEHQVHLITCPRRFGKSINMEMIKVFLSIEVNESEEIINADSTTLFKVLTKVRATGKKLKIFNYDFLYDHYKKYPVIFIDFQNVRGNDLCSVQQTLRQEICKAFAEHKYMLNILNKIKEDPESKADDKRTAKLGIETFNKYYSNDALTDVEIISGLACLSTILCNYFKTKTKKKVIILIDEYDTPINFCITNSSSANNQDDKNIKDIQSFIDRVLIATLKANKNCLYMGLMTGVSGIVRASENSGLNNVQHCKFLDTGNKFQKYYGVTEQEIDSLIETLCFTDVLNFKEMLKNKYNGYTYIDHTNASKNSLYNIWAVMNACYDAYYQKQNNNNFHSHWTDSANIKCIENTFKLPEIRKKNEKLIAGEKLKISLLSRVTIDDLILLKQLSSLDCNYKVTNNHINLFFSYIFESGYLNVENINGEYYISIPNSDVKDEFIKINIDYIINKYSLSQETLDNSTDKFTVFIKNLESKEEHKKDFLDALNALFSQMTFAKIQDSQSGNQQNEDLFHSILNMIIIRSSVIKKFGTEITLNDGIDRGRSDIIFITTDDIAGIVEVKCLLSADAAIQQTEQYARILKTQYRGILSKIVKIGINVDNFNTVDMLCEVYQNEELNCSSTLGDTPQLYESSS